MSQLFTLVGLDAGTAKLSQPVEVTYEQNKKDGVVTHKTRIHYSLAALTIVAGVFCLGAEACHHQITLKWCANAALTEEGWADAAAMRCGPSRPVAGARPYGMARPADDCWDDMNVRHRT